MVFRLSAICASLAFVLAACASPDDPALPDDRWRGDDTDPDPMDLSLQVAPAGADALNPHGDGSGLVVLTAAAPEADRFVFEVDGGEPVESTSGQIELRVDREGAHAYRFTVTAWVGAEPSEPASEIVTIYRSTQPFPRLVWADEFDVDGPVDPERWVFQTIPPLDGGWFNGEHQHYTDRLDNAFVSDGTLKIVARRERFTTHGSTRDFTSARMNSRFTFVYGRVEVRARLPVQTGTWPAIWTLGANINEIGNPFGDLYGDVGWPACGEIDIMEQTGWDKQRTIAHFHWGDRNTGAYRNEGGELSVPRSTTDFHVYALHWDERALRVTVDDRLVYELPNDPSKPYDHLHYLLLNIAMGGNLGGGIPADFSQATMEVDYVRVYQRALADVEG